MSEPAEITMTFLLTVLSNGINRFTPDIKIFSQLREKKEERGYTKPDNGSLAAIFLQNNKIVLAMTNYRFQ